jgi:NitT/TauT family transport system ATP-binding protein
LIEVRGLTCKFAIDDGVTVALDDVNLSLPAGSFAAVIGRSGAGKSTLLHCIGGLLRPTSGSVLIDGDVVKGPSNRVSYVFQSPCLLPWLTVLDNVLSPITVHRKPTAEETARAHLLLETVGLAQVMRARPAQLSGGMQQRVGVARALVTQPRVLLLDEPFGALDAQTREALDTEIQVLWGARRPTVVFVTHDLSEAILVADEIVVLAPNPGRVQEVMTVDIPERPRLPHAIENDERYWQLRAAVRRALFADHQLPEQRTRAYASPRGAL